jgi:hypothetical protein
MESARAGERCEVLPILALLVKRSHWKCCAEFARQVLAYVPYIPPRTT